MVQTVPCGSTSITPPPTSSFRLIDATTGRVVFELDYNAQHYQRLYQSDFTTAAAEQDLSDWDFFVALQGAIEIFEERAASGRVAFSAEVDGSAQIQGQRHAPR